MCVNRKRVPVHIRMVSGGHTCLEEPSASENALEAVPEQTRRTSSRLREEEPRSRVSLSNDTSLSGFKQAFVCGVLNILKNTVQR